MDDYDEANYRTCRIGLLSGNNAGSITDQEEDDARAWLEEIVEKAAMYDGLCD